MNRSLPSAETLQANIIAVYNQATPEELTEGLNWYSDAHKEIRRIARRTGSTIEQVAGVTAAISPGLRWSRNLFWAEELCVAFNERRAETLKVPTYSYANVTKAIRILTGEQPIDGPDGILSGPKVTAFYRLLRDGGNTTDVTIDGHAVSIAVNHRYGIRTGHSKLAKLPTVTPKTLGILRDAYRAAAHTLGVEPHQAQAVTWVTWRRLHLTHSTGG